MSDLWDNRPLLPIVHPCATQGPQLRSPQRHSCLRFRNRGGDKSIWARACRVQARENPKKFGAAVGGKAGPCRGCCCGGVRRLTVAAVCVREVPGSASSGLPGVAVLPQPCGGSRWPQCPRQPTQLTVGEFSRCLTPLTDVYLFTYSQKSNFLPEQIGGCAQASPLVRPWSNKKGKEKRSENQSFEYCSSPSGGGR